MASFLREFQFHTTLGHWASAVSAAQPEHLAGSTDQAGFRNSHQNNKLNREALEQFRAKARL